MQVRILIIHDSHGGSLAELASAIQEGASQVKGAGVTLKHVLEAQGQDLLSVDALVLGSPNWSGITGRLKLWLDDTGDLYESGQLAGKVGAAFTTGRGRNSGVEFTLLSLLHWMLACGMVIVGLPWSDALERSGSYYGATAVGNPTAEDLAQARSLGRRVAETALAIKMGRVHPVP